MGSPSQSPPDAPLFEVLALAPARLGELPRCVGRLDHLSLVAAAERHGVAVLVADALEAAGARLSQGAAARLTLAARQQIAQACRIKRLTLQVVDALSLRGVNPVLLKGAGLAQRLYPEQPLGRPSTDVDVLVEHGALPAAREAMRELGLNELRDASLRNVFKEHHHLSFAGARGLVEVHFRLFSGFGGNAFDDLGIRSRLVDGLFEGRRVHWLSPEDEFVYLATHAANHAFLRASWLVDLQRCVQQPLDWELMAERCRAAHFSAAVAASLFVLERALGVTLPSAGAAAFPLSAVRRLGHSVVFSPTHLEAADLAAHRLFGFGLRLWLVDSPRDALRHASDGARRLLRHLRARAT